MKARRMLIAGVVVVVAGLLGAAPAWAVPTTQVVQGDVLRLVSVADWDAASTLLPGQSVRWDVAVSADAPDPGTVTIGVSADGGAPLVVDASICLRAWEADACPGGATVLRSSWDIPRDGGEVRLTSIRDTQVAHVRFTIALGADDDGGATEVRVHAQGVGESAIVGPGGGLATTGMSPIVPWIFGGGAVLLAAGLVLVLVRRRRGGDEEGES